MTRLQSWEQRNPPLLVFRGWSLAPVPPWLAPWAASLVLSARPAEVTRRHHAHRRMVAWRTIVFHYLPFKLYMRSTIVHTHLHIVSDTLPKIIPWQHQHLATLCNAPGALVTVTHTLTRTWCELVPLCMYVSLMKWQLDKVSDNFNYPYRKIME